MAEYGIIIMIHSEEATSLCDIKYKIVFLGDMSVGKSSIIERFINGYFDDTHQVPLPLCSTPLASTFWRRMSPIISTYTGCNSGTRPARRSFAASSPLTSETLTAPLLSTTSPT